MSVTPAHFATYPPERGGKTCNRCGEWRWLEEYSPVAHGKDGYATSCKPCLAAARRQTRPGSAAPESVPVKNEREQLPADPLTRAVHRWNRMHASARRRQRQQCARRGHRFRPSDFSPRWQVCLACCAYQETPQ